MRPRARLLIGFAGLALGVAIASTLGRARRPEDSGDRRLSTYLAGPDGARGLADALERLGIETAPWRRRLRDLPDSALAARHAFVLLQPSIGLNGVEIRTLVDWHVEAPAGTDLHLVGDQAARVMECFGWTTRVVWSAEPIRTPGEAGQPGSVAGTRILVPRNRPRVERPSLLTAADPVICEVPDFARVDTLLMSGDSGVVALRLVMEDEDRAVVLVAEADLYRNASLRRTDAGPLVLGWFAGRYDRVTFEEAHHGFGSGGSLGRAALEWSRRSPWGWALWQLAAVGLLVLLAGAIRFGPIRPGIERRRRSPLEHVRALAAALAARRGHDVAIAALVRGLRRRLQPTGPLGADPRPWLLELEQRARNPEAKAGASRLLDLTVPGQPSAAVLTAAHTVEDLWHSLR